MVGLSRNRVSKIIGNANFGNIDTLLSQGRDMVYIARHYNMDFALAQPRALRRGLRLVERAGRGGYQNGIPQKTVSNHLPKMPELANPVNADLQRGIIDRNRRRSCRNCFKCSGFPDRLMLCRDHQD